jgi:hypothetical protein
MHHRPTLPIESIPSWAHLNNVSFHHVKITEIDGRGYGVVCDGDVAAAEEPGRHVVDTDDDNDGTAAAAPAPSLLTVPHGLVLNAAAVDEYAKEDKNFRQLLDAIGHRVTGLPFFFPFPDPW